MLNESPVMPSILIDKIRAMANKKYAWCEDEKLVEQYRSAYTVGAIDLSQELYTDIKELVGIAEYYTNEDCDLPDEDCECSTHIRKQTLTKIKQKYVEETNHDK